MQDILRQTGDREALEELQRLVDKLNDIQTSRNAGCMSTNAAAVAPRSLVIEYKSIPYNVVSTETGVVFDQYYLITNILMDNYDESMRQLMKDCGFVRAPADICHGAANAFVYRPERHSRILRACRLTFCSTMSYIHGGSIGCYYLLANWFNSMCSILRHKSRRLFQVLLMFTFVAKFIWYSACSVLHCISAFANDVMVDWCSSPHPIIRLVWLSITVLAILYRYMPDQAIHRQNLANILCTHVDK